MEHVLLLGLIIAAAHAVETATGFGATLLALALGVHLMPLETLFPAVVLLGIVQSAWILARDPRGVAWGELGRRVLPWMGLGLVLGILGRPLVPGYGLEVLLGLFVIAVALRALLAPAAAPGPAAPFLLAGGVFHGLLASGGPLVVHHLGTVIPGKQAFRATLAALWLLLNGAILLSLGAGALASGLRLGAVLLPALALGVLVGERVHTRLAPLPFRRAVNVVLILAGASLLRGAP